MTIKRLTIMEIRVLKVRGEASLDELKEVIATGHTVTRQGQDGWQMPASSQVGDLAIWYSGVPQQEFVAYGWVCGLPYKPKEEQRKYYGPVCGVAGLPNGPKPRAEVGAASDFMADADEVVPMAQTVPRNHGAFLLALGFSPRFVEARQHISEEVARCIETIGGAQ
jgi:hypothetical protein